jgi:hypothetical protein
VDRKDVIERELNALEADLARGWDRKQQFRSDIQELEFQLASKVAEEAKARLAETLARKKIEFHDLEVQMERLERDRHALILEQKQENDWLERRKLARKRKLPP